MSKLGFKPYETFSWHEERKDLIKSGVAIITIPLLIWLLCYVMPLLYLVFHLHIDSQRSMFYSLLPNLIMVGVGGLLLWFTMQLYGNTVRRYMIPSYMHQKMKEWKGELKQQRKDLAVRKNTAAVLDEKLFNHPYEDNDEGKQRAFELLMESRQKLQREIESLERSIIKQSEELLCFENVIVPKSLLSRIFTMLRHPYEICKGYVRTSEIFHLTEL